MVGGNFKILLYLKGNVSLNKPDTILYFISVKISVTVYHKINLVSLSVSHCQSLEDVSNRLTIFIDKSDVSSGKYLSVKKNT